MTIPGRKKAAVQCAAPRPLRLRPAIPTYSTGRWVVI